MTEPLVKLLEVPYFYQRDNQTVYGRPDSECNLTAHAMALDYFTDGYITQRAKANGLREPEDWYAYHLYKEGDTTDNSAHTRAIYECLNIKSEHRTDGSLDDLIDQLRLSIPVPIGVHYKSSGHWVTVIGVDEPNRMFRVHDPYGCRSGSSDYYFDTSPLAGKADYYSYQLMDEVWSRQGNDGWYRFLPDLESLSSF